MALCPMNYSFDQPSRRIRFKWCIPLFSSSLELKKVKVFHDFYDIYLESDAESEWTSIKLSRDNTGRDVTVSFGMINRDGTEEEILGQQKIQKDSRVLTIKNFLRFRDLRRRIRELAPVGILTLTFTFVEELPSVENSLVVQRSDMRLLPDTIDTEEERSENRGAEDSLVVQRSDMRLLPDTIDTEEERSENRGAEGFDGSSMLIKDLEDWLLSGEDHDLCFEIGKNEFGAHKNILSARFPILCANLRRERKDKERVRLDDCDIDAFKAFILYGYTGKVGNVSIEKAMGLYYISRKFGDEKLKKFCVGYLKNKLSMSSFCDVVDFARTHGETELLECGYRFFYRNTKEILCSREWQEYGKRNFEAVNEVYTKAYETLKN